MVLCVHCNNEKIDVNPTNVCIWALLSLSLFFLLLFHQFIHIDDGNNTQIKEKEKGKTENSAI